MLRKRASDALLSTEELQFLNGKIAESLELKHSLNNIQNDETAAEIRSSLLKNFKDLLAYTNPKSDKHRAIPPSAFTMAMKRRHDRLQKEEEERRIQERKMADQQYVEQLRKMELVENYIRDFERRGIDAGLSLDRLASMLRTYRNVEAERVFNNSNVHRMSIEKFIGDHQETLYMLQRRHIDFIETNIKLLRDRAARNRLCPPDMITVEHMLSAYRKVAAFTAGKEELYAELKKRSEIERLKIEKFIGSKQSDCDPSTKFTLGALV